MVQAANVNVGLNLEVRILRLWRRTSAPGDGLASGRDPTGERSHRYRTRRHPQFAKRFYVRANDNLKSFGNKVQQIGYQVGDFAIQIASGGNALTAFIQQGVAGRRGIWDGWRRDRGCSAP